MPAATPLGLLTDDMRRVLTEQRLGFVATVCPDGTPNLSQGHGRGLGRPALGLRRPAITPNRPQPAAQPSR